MGGNEFLANARQLIGNFDDILDMVVIPPENHEDSKLKFAVVSNSSQVRIMNDVFTSSPLEGHTDIVLAADSSPDG